MANTAMQPPAASVVAALAPNSCVRALRATRRCRRSACTRTSSGSQTGGAWYFGSESAFASGRATHSSNSASSLETEAGVTPREPGTPGRRDGVTEGDSEGAGGAGVGLGAAGADAARGAARSTSATLTGAGGASTGASVPSSSRSTRRMIRRGGHTPVRRDSSSSSLMFTIDRPVRLPAAKP